METTPVVTLMRTLSSAASRRGVLAGLATGLLTARSFALGIDDAEARKKGKRKNKKRKNKKQNQPVTRADAVCGEPAFLIFFFGGKQRLAQTFTALATGSLVRAELALRKEEGTDGDFILQLGEVDDFGIPTNDVLAVTSEANFRVPAGDSTVSFTFGKPFSVVEGVQYSLILSRPGSNQVTWLGNIGDLCAGRGFESGSQSAPFVPPPASGFDFVFTTFVRS